MNMENCPPELSTSKGVHMAPMEFHLNPTSLTGHAATGRKRDLVIVLGSLERGKCVRPDPLIETIRANRQPWWKPNNTPKN